MSVADGAVLRCSARFRDNQGNDLVNVWNFLTDFTAPQDELDVYNACDDYLSAFYTQYDSVVDDDVVPFDLKVDVVEFSGGDWLVTQNVGFQSWGSTITPTAVGTPLPPGDAILGKLYTGLGKHTGKKFFGGFVDTVIDSAGNVTSAFQATLLGYLADMLTPFIFDVTESLITVVLDQADGTIREVLGVGVSDIIAYQRRRRPGTGS